MDESENRRRAFVEIYSVQNRNGMLKWIKAHKKELIIAGISISSIIGIVLGMKNKQSLLRLWESLIVAVEKKCQTQIKGMPEIIPVVEVMDVTPDTEIIVVNPDTIRRLPHEVSAHLRILPDGMQASAEKIASATENGFDLSGGGVTWVQKYSTGNAA